MSVELGLRRESASMTLQLKRGNDSNCCYCCIVTVVVIDHDMVVVCYCCIVTVVVIDHDMVVVVTVVAMVVGW